MLKRVYVKVEGHLWYGNVYLEWWMYEMLEITKVGIVQKISLPAPTFWSPYPKDGSAKLCAQGQELSSRMSVAVEVGVRGK